MEKELKIAELATIWGVSVPTTWNRVKKMGLKTFIKKNETNKDINYVSISDEQIKEFVININNNNNNLNNNGYYEETLSNNKVINAVEDIIDAEIIKEKQSLLPEVLDRLNNVYNEQNQQIININNVHNEQIINVYNGIKNLYEELAFHKANTQRLEDKKASEGIYLNEINELKQEKENLNKDYNDLKIDYNNVNNEKENVLKDYKELSEKFDKEEREKRRFKTIAIIGGILIGLMAVVLAVFITIFTIDNKDVNNVSETVTNVQQPVTDINPQPARNVSNQRKR